VSVSRVISVHTCVRIRAHTLSSSAISRPASIRTHTRIPRGLKKYIYKTKWKINRPPPAIVVYTRHYSTTLLIIYIYIYVYTVINKWQLSLPYTYPSGRIIYIYIRVYTYKWTYKMENGYIYMIVGIFFIYIYLFSLSPSESAPPRVHIYIYNTIRSRWNLCQPDCTLLLLLLLLHTLCTKGVRNVIRERRARERDTRSDDFFGRARVFPPLKY